MSKVQYTAWIGTNSTRNSQGIYTVSIDGETLQPQIISAQKAYNTGALALSRDGKRLYAASEGMSFMGRASGGAMAFSADATGKLSLINAIPVGGQRPCCLSLDDDEGNLYSANFLGGSISVMSLRADGGIDSVKRMITEPKEDGWLHAMHSVAVLTPRKYVAAINVSQSEIVVYDARTGARLGDYCFGKRVFARSVAVHGEFIYAMLQDPGELYVFQNRIAEGGGIELIQRCPVIPGWQGFAGTSALRISPDGKLLMAAVRRANSISVFRIKLDGTLMFCNNIVLPGETPRDFMISPDGELVVVAMQFSDEIKILKVDREGADLILAGEGIKIPSPASVVIRKENAI